MANALVPPSSDLNRQSILIDDGTLPRTALPTPDAIGLDAKGSTPKQSQPSMAEQIVSYPRQRRGQQVGDGECFTLADRALRNAGARSAADYGTVTPNADYVWGNAVNLGDLRPGDVIQFSGYRYDREIDTPEGTTSDFQERPHHTAIVERVDGNGAVTVLEQNAPKGAPVARNQLFFTTGTTRTGNTTTTITVQGTFWFYRPQPR